jgi:ABC-type polysaccharide/polyol phosphate transport system ATPase subunit
VTGTQIIRMAGAGKRYTKYQDAPMLVTRLAGLRAKTRTTKLWAVRPLDLEIGAGECVGVVGRNGSGKSTMLRMLAGVTGPTVGRVTVHGRIAPLISVGVGFHRELTGRENVYVNGTILGLTRTEIDQRLDRIVDFAEVGAFIDTPVKFYSSGMFVRLGFAVAIMADPAVLLVDEVLAVGDLAFQIKCFERMREIKDQGTTVVVVSHNLNAIRLLCPRTVVLHDSELKFDGPTEPALSLYHQLLGEDRSTSERSVDTRPSGIVTDAYFEPLELLDPDGMATSHFTSGQSIRVRVPVVFEREVVDPALQLRFTSESGVVVFQQAHPFSGRRYKEGDRETFEIRLQMRLGTGSYTATAELVTLKDFVRRATPPPGYLFFVSGPAEITGLVDLGAKFKASSRSAPRSAS